MTRGRPFALEMPSIHELVGCCAALIVLASCEDHPGKRVSTTSNNASPAPAPPVLPSAESVGPAAPATSDPEPGTTFVDGRNTTGLSDGSDQHPFRTIQDGIRAAAGSGLIRVAGGVYAEELAITVGMKMEGGYRGASEDEYKAGQPGDFRTRSWTQSASQLNGQGDLPVISVDSSSAVVIDGFTISGGSHGVRLSGGGHTVRNCVIQDNGDPARNAKGGGVEVTGPMSARVDITDSIIRRNKAGRGGAISVGGTNVHIERNLVEDNAGTSDHGAAIYAAGTGIVSFNFIRNNQLPGFDNVGGGGGILVYNQGTDYELSYNVITGNHVFGVGAGIFVDDGARARIDHDLIYGNSVQDTGGAGIFIDGPGGSGATITFCTIAFNTGGYFRVQDRGNGVLLRNDAHAVVQSSIFFGNEDDFFFVQMGAPSTLDVNDTLSQQGWAGEGNITGADPLFANAAAGDYHLRSSAGRFENGNWVEDADTSPAVGAVNAGADGGQAAPPTEMGVFGDTPEASRIP